ncbi:hypothetical protein KSS87_003724 [Heliosperma pusillum]|nr:hypothetical protein KSS87_003724 [Heliosperma pusillum]
MKPFYHLILTILSWLVLSPCSCLPNLGRNRSNHVQCIDTERGALLQFKHDLNDTCGMLTSWEPHTDCCLWRGIVCSNLTSHVVELSLGSPEDDPCLEGNPGLCGAPLLSCAKDRAPSNVPKGDNTNVQNKDDDFDFFLGLYISVVLGFIVGFWGVCGTLVIKTSWRHAYFRLLDNIKDRIKIL